MHIRKKKSTIIMLPQHLKIYISFYLFHFCHVFLSTRKHFPWIYSLIRYMDATMLHCTLCSVFYHLPFVINPRHFHDRIKKKTKINIKRKERKKKSVLRLIFSFFQEKIKTNNGQNSKIGLRIMKNEKIILFSRIKEYR